MKAVNFRMRCVWSLDAGSYTWFGAVVSLHLVQYIGSLVVPKNRYSVLDKISYVRWGFRNLTKDYITSFLYKESPFLVD